MTAGYTEESIRRSFADFASQKAALECAKEQAEQVFARSKTIDITVSGLVMLFAHRSIIDLDHTDMGNTF